MLWHQSHISGNIGSISHRALLGSLDGDIDAVNMMGNSSAKRKEIMVDRVNSISGLSCKKNGAFYPFTKSVGYMKRNGRGRLTKRGGWCNLFSEENKVRS